MLYHERPGAGNPLKTRMNMYKTDDKGEYRTAERWARAWSGGGSYVAGFSICELREYADGTSRVYVSDPVYTHENPGIAFAHSVYMLAQKELGV